LEHFRFDTLLPDSLSLAPKSERLNGDVRAILSILVVLLLLLQYKLWFGDGSITEVRELERAIEAQRKENESLRQRNRALEAEVNDLKTGLDAIEERARSELGMIREGETFYQIVESQADRSKDRK